MADADTPPDDQPTESTDPTESQPDLPESGFFGDDTDGDTDDVDPADGSTRDTASDTASGESKKRWPVIAVGLVALAALGVGGGYLVHSATNKPGDAAATDDSSTAASASASANSTASSPDTAASSASSSASSTASSASSAARPSATTPASSARTKSMPADSALVVDGAKVASFKSWKQSSVTAASAALPNQFLCQVDRLAGDRDPQSWVRTYTSGGNTIKAYESLTKDAATAAKSYDQVLSWMGNCLVGRVQQLDASTVSGLTNTATAVRFRQLADHNKVRFHTVTVSRIGRVVAISDLTTTKQPDLSKPVQASDPSVAMAQAQARAGCKPGGGTCPKGTPKAALTSLRSSATGFPNPDEMPILAKTSTVWNAANPVKVTQPVGSGCDQIKLDDPNASSATARSFLIPDQSVPPAVGVDVTMLTYAKADTAASVLTKVESGVKDCKKSMPNAKVTEPSGGSVKGTGFTGKVWWFTYDLGQGQTTQYRIGVVVAGSRVMHVSSAVVKDWNMTDGEFIALVKRIGARAAATR